MAVACSVEKSRMELLSVSDVAAILDVPPRRISDLFYARKLCTKTCPVTAGVRLIPREYVDRIRSVLAREDRIRAAKAQEE